MNRGPPKRNDSRLSTFSNNWKIYNLKIFENLIFFKDFNQFSVIFIEIFERLSFESFAHVKICRKIIFSPFQDIWVVSTVQNGFQKFSPRRSLRKPPTRFIFHSVPQFFTSRSHCTLKTTWKKIQNQTNS